MTVEVKKNKKSKKADGINKPLGLHNSFLQKLLTRAILVLAPAANMFGTSQFPVGCMIWQHICYFGDNLRSPLDHNFPSRLTDVTPYSSSDLLSSSLLVPLTWTNYSRSNSLSPFYSLGQKYSKSKLPVSFALLGLKILSPTPNLQKYSRSIFFSDLEKLPLFAYLFHTLATGALEPKQCPITLASVLAGAHSVD